MIENNKVLAVQRKLNQAFQMPLNYKPSDAVTREKNKLCKVGRRSSVFSFVYTKQNIELKWPLLQGTESRLYHSLKKALRVI